MEKEKYKILDTGNGKKLEKIGPYLLVRPYSQAVWRTSLNESVWKSRDGEFLGQLDGGNGRWVFDKKISDDFVFKYSGMNFKCKFSDYGHVGIFFEQHDNWKWLEENVIKGGHYLNLFAYTGGSSLFVSRHAKVTHVDSSNPVIKWARTNFELSGISLNNARFVLEDAAKFVQRERKRNNQYDGIIMDPPTFGRGVKSEIWKIDRDIMNLIENCKALLTPRANIFLLTSHTPGFTHQVLRNCLMDFFPDSNSIQSGDMILHEDGKTRELPCGSFARWLKK
ncbi:MAG: hypothetical protein ACD_79C00945G0002 [uncultured bacterium]|nr:MAG: hypothetical protein ACD_79C00945G0002 [uncultured bacterium]